MKRSIMAISIALVVFGPQVFATDQPVVINEIAWMGTTTSANDEWIELHNTSSKSISLVGWKLQSADEKIRIALKSTIPENGYYLLERTDNSSVADISADIIYKGALNNSGGHLLLYDNSGTIVDEVTFPTRWPAGNATSKQTMERTTSGWQTSVRTDGTPKAVNSIKSAKATTLSQPLITNLPKQEKSVNSDSVSTTTAAVNVPQETLFNQELIPTNSSNSWLLFITALALAIISAVSIISVKLFITSKNHVRS